MPPFALVVPFVEPFVCPVAPLVGGLLSPFAIVPSVSGSHDGHISDRKEV